MSEQVEVLVVEDESLLSELMLEVLSDHNVKVTLAVTADQGRELFAQSPDQWGLVITDVLTPGRSTGCDLAWDVHRGQPQIPVLVCTGFMTEICNLPPSAQMLAKPWSLSQFEERVVHALAQAVEREVAAPARLAPAASRSLAEVTSQQATAQQR
ncbi:MULTISPECIES: response regulator [unclassified Pseudomonas]|uniref:response regulator n=1 Tax=unclassified Pseudomonas TaxID=196821 RepID=UPI000BC99F12|nr:MULTISPECIES: response regulator [unclassified Pseudomonas]PVZ19541.1 response regulator receiver domain-containing protein [Pseudomonas sp. URIL14HWK12:I12]PVZ22874.1 response regulator receiver domain-containing protein [Pseudomonas sp. URIL14HWK12:I10]PVZ37496.1 response regulator receiver domain-containing protein [Pseudomonas sp. URIL14HWK12:I11]SNZ14923.1 Response regulator containing CheY-like receiver, AAA-type ATPase, and DNA-binding domains [Pseudomonas sp. URIL14HWK12:I9]